MEIAFLGHESLEFVRDDVVALCTAPELDGVRLRLHDPHPGRFAHALALAKAIATHTGGRVTVDGYPRRADALDGADYVVSELEVGGIAALRREFEIPAKYGVRQAIGDTLGLGGIFRGLRTLPVVLDIARDMQRHCPDAVFLSYTNPMVASIWALGAGSALRQVYGLCHAVADAHRHLADLLAVPVEELDLCTAGYNHQAFVLRCEHRGTSMYPRLARVLADLPAPERPVTVELFRRFGYWSTEHRAEDLPWFLRHDEEVRRLGVRLNQHEASEAGTQEAIATDRRRLDEGQAPDLTAAPAMAAEFVHAVETGQAREMYLSLRNDGWVGNLPAGSGVEVPCRVDAAGVHPVAVGDLPLPLVALNRAFISVVELTVRAVLDRDLDHVYQAALLDPNTAATLTMAQTVEVCDALLHAHGDLVPPLS